MRINRLDLIAYGHFTNRSLDLSAGNHGVHIIYGPNEAGKSSSLRALTAWLFGFPTSTDDDFLHSYPNLRVGGVLANQQGQTLECIRRKGKNNTLRDRDDSGLISQESLAKFIPAIDEKHFDRLALRAS